MKHSRSRMIKRAFKRLGIYISAHTVFFRAALMFPHFPDLVLSDHLSIFGYYTKRCHANHSILRGSSRLRYISWEIVPLFGRRGVRVLFFFRDGNAAHVFLGQTNWD